VLSLGKRVVGMKLVWQGLPIMYWFAKEKRTKRKKKLIWWSRFEYLAVISTKN
jgi:hypothetical protein